MELFFKRRSFRTYTEKPVSEQELEAILRAGMAAPSSDNDQEWEFIIVNDPACCLLQFVWIWEVFGWGCQPVTERRSAGFYLYLQ